MMELQKRVDELRQSLNKEQQKMLSLNSIQNFLWSYDKLKQFKPEVQKLLIEYFNVIKEENYIIDKKTSTRIAFDYILKIGIYYSRELGFKIEKGLKFTLMVGFHADALLLIIGLLKRVYYIPITTLIMLCYWWYLNVFYERKNKVYNVRY